MPYKDKEKQKAFQRKYFEENRRLFYNRSTIGKRKLTETNGEYVASVKISGCSICGYNKCRTALDFHHLDPSVKEKSIAAMVHSSSLSKLQKEIEKCILLCSNCHHEVHEGILILK